MRITIACKYFSMRGGAQTFLLNFARRLIRDGHSVKVIAMEIEGEMEGIERHPVPLPPVPKALRDVVFARKTKKNLADDDSDLSFGEQKTLGVDIVRPGGGVHKEYISQVIKSYPTPASRLLYGITKRLSLKEYMNLYIERNLYNDPGLKCVIANSNLVKEHVLKHYPHLKGKVTVVYNGADCRRFTPDLKKHRESVISKLDIPSDAHIASFVSFDLRRKGISTTLQAMALLKSRFPHKPFYLIVVGKEKGWTKRLAKKLGVSGQVRFAGPQEPDIYYGASDIFVLPTFFDPCANVTFEALACGLPVLTSAQNGAYDRLTPGENGFYIEDSADATTLAGFWEHFFDRAKLAEASESARKLALSHTVDDMFDELMEVLVRTHQNQMGDVDHATDASL